MTDIVKHMVHVYQNTEAGSEGSMRAALLFLADEFAAPVSASGFDCNPKIRALIDAINAYDKTIVSNRYEQMACAISAAIRAAAGGGE